MRLAAAFAPRRAGNRVVGIAFGPQREEVLLFLSIDKGAVHPPQLVDRIEEDERAIAAGRAGAAAHAVRQAHHRLDGRRGASDIAPAGFDFGLDEEEIFASARIGIAFAGKRPDRRHGIATDQAAPGGRRIAERSAHADGERRRTIRINLCPVQETTKRMSDLRPMNMREEVDLVGEQRTRRRKPGFVAEDAAIVRVVHPLVQRVCRWQEEGWRRLHKACFGPNPSAEPPATAEAVEPVCALLAAGDLEEQGGFTFRTAEEGKVELARRGAPPAPCDIVGMQAIEPARHGGDLKPDGEQGHAVDLAERGQIFGEALRLVCREANPRIGDDGACTRYPRKPVGRGSGDHRQASGLGLAGPGVGGNDDLRITIAVPGAQDFFEGALLEAGDLGIRTPLTCQHRRGAIERAQDFRFRCEAVPHALQYAGQLHVAVRLAAVAQLHLEAAHQIRSRIGVVWTEALFHIA